MPDYGPQPDGTFVPKPLQAFVDEINDFQLANVSPNLDVSDRSPQGELNRSFAIQFAQLWEVGQQLHGALDPDEATGALLQNLSKLTGTSRRQATHSAVVASVTIAIPDTAESVTLISGVHFAALDGAPENQWTPVEDFVATSDGMHQVLFRSAERGPINAPAGTLTVISTSLTGWTAITNIQDATPGNVVGDDDQLRADREAAIARAGSGTVLAIRADVAAVESVNAVDVFENKLDHPVDGIPPHAVEVLIDDGDPPAGDDDAIAQAIFDSTGAGPNWASNTGDSGTATDSEGAQHTVPFSRVQFVDIHLAYTLETTSEYAGDSEFALFVRDRARELYQDAGSEIVALRLEALALQFPGVTDVTAFALDTIGSPTATDNIELGSRQKASFNESNVDVTTT